MTEKEAYDNFITIFKQTAEDPEIFFQFIKICSMCNTRGIIQCKNFIFPFTKTFCDSTSCTCAFEDEYLNIIPINENIIESIKPISSDYDVYTFEIKVNIALFPTKSEDEKSQTIQLSLFNRSPNVAYDSEICKYNLGINHIYSQITDANSLQIFLTLAQDIFVLRGNSFNSFPFAFMLMNENVDNAKPENSLPIKFFEFDDRKLFFDIGDATYSLEFDKIQQIIPIINIYNEQYVVELRLIDSGYTQFIIDLSFPEKEANSNP